MTCSGHGARLAKFPNTPQFRWWSDANFRRRAARSVPASHVSVVVYHRVENKGFRGVPTLCAMRRVDESGDDVSYDVALRRLLSARGDCSRAVIKRVDQKGANLASPPTWGEDPLTMAEDRDRRPCQPFVEYVSMVWPDAASCDAFAAGDGRTVAESTHSDEASDGDSSS